jgi:hypothetical protein
VRFVSIKIMVRCSRHAFFEAVARAEFGFTSGPACLLETHPTGPGERSRSANHRLPMNARAPRHLTLAQALLERLRGCHTPPF